MWSHSFSAEAFLHLHYFSFNILRCTYVPFVGKVYWVILVYIVGAVQSTRLGNGKKPVRAPKAPFTN